MEFRLGGNDLKFEFVLSSGELQEDAAQGSSLAVL